MKLQTVVLAALAIVLAPMSRPSVFAQAIQLNDDATLPRFDVTSVKPNRSGENSVRIGSRGRRFSATGATVRMLLRTAYPIQDFQIVGGPNWLDTERYDVSATASEAPNDVGRAEAATQQQKMLRALLRDRFNMRVRVEMRQMPVYALILARRDRQLGPQLRPATGECGAGAQGRDDNRATPGAQPPRLTCGTNVAPGMITGGSITIAQLGMALSRLTNTGSSLDRVVTDRTGMTGSFDVELRFTPDRMPNFEPAGPPAAGEPIDPNGPSLFTAVQEQLGLKLDPQRGPVDVLVIDNVDRPTSD